MRTSSLTLNPASGAIYDIFTKPQAPVGVMDIAWPVIEVVDLTSLRNDRKKRIVAATPLALLVVAHGRSFHRSALGAHHGPIEVEGETDEALFENPVMAQFSQEIVKNAHRARSEGS